MRYQVIITPLLPLFGAAGAKCRDWFGSDLCGSAQLGSAEFGLMNAGSRAG